VSGDGPFVVADLDDLRHLAGSRCTTGDLGALWRVLREAGRLKRLEDGRVELVVSGRHELDAWVRRAQVSARRERSAFAQAMRGPEGPLPGAPGGEPSGPLEKPAA
jgi:hypothetical protein